MNDIKLKIDDLFVELKSYKLYEDYIRVKKQLEENEEITNVITEIKRYQKIATNNSDEVIEQKIKELYAKLESYPVYQSYLIIKETLNEELFMIKEVFDKYFEEILKI